MIYVPVISSLFFKKEEPEPLVAAPPAPAPTTDVPPSPRTPPPYEYPFGWRSDPSIT